MVGCPVDSLSSGYGNPMELFIIGILFAAAVASTDRGQRWTDQLPGGLADKRKPSDFDPRALKKGIRVEMEHTSDRKIATEIAMDHLEEHSNYYEVLEEAEREMKRRKARKGWSHNKR